ncbi:hypothetical protein C1H46_006306 [Malus baccata]|uniref:Uncharacterized protein n=1 Tax=Malus baccata TaxID=106549 RepID=A0A540NAG7_MALBA|nr:hypothetical protein C1H46_006306 [Malus baccata]
MKGSDILYLWKPTIIPVPLLSECSLPLFLTSRARSNDLISTTPPPNWQPFLLGSCSLSPFRAKADAPPWKKMDARRQNDGCKLTVEIIFPAASPPPFRHAVA